MGPTICPDTSVRNYHYSLRNNSEECSSHGLDLSNSGLGRLRAVVQGDSVAIGPKLLSIKNYVIEIMT